MKKVKIFFQVLTSLEYNSQTINHLVVEIYFS